MAHEHPASPDGITADYLTGLMAELCPGVQVRSVGIADAKAYGEQMVSTAGRVVVDVTYDAGSPDGLPSRLVIKVARGVDTIMAPFYSNEVAFYRRLRPTLRVEAPRCFGAHFDADSTRFALVLEDLTARGARFPNVTQRTGEAEIRALLDTLSGLHAQFWNSPHMAGVQTHLSGGVAELMNGLAPRYIQHEIDTENFKREMVQRLRMTGDTLLAGVQAVQRHQASLSQTLLHGDAHLGNTYLLPDGRGGLLDWQLSVRGYALHDVSYLIATGLSVADRRAHERALLGYYLERLAQLGAEPVPSAEEAWREYRRGMAWAVYIGWLTTPVINYGWEINLLNHLRLTTAYEDLETTKLVSELQ